MKRIIFLDIDGCVNSEKWYRATKGMKGHFDPEVIALLNTLKDLDVEVVVSSSWGEDGVKQLRNVGLELPIVGTTEHFHCDWMCRGNEIEKWLHDTFKGLGSKYGPNYKDKNYNYAIIDDDCDMLYGQKDNFVYIDRWVGITEEDIKKVREILMQ